MNFYEYIGLFIAAVGGGMFYFATKTTNPNYLKLALAFSGAYLFTITVVNLIPGLYLSNSGVVGYYILGGFFLQIILEFFSEGIEHGHVHSHKSHIATIPYSLMAGLCIHSFLEGMPLAAPFEHEHHHQTFLFGIILHHIPVAFALVSMLSLSGLKKNTIIYLLLFFALMTPAGAWVSTVLSETDILNVKVYFGQIMGVVVGIFLHISTTILFETGSDHKYNRNKIVIIVLGAAAALMI
jgi:zinc and cadmium transporter